MQETQKMFLSVEMLQARTRQLEAFRYVGLESIAPFAAMPGGADRDAVNAEIPGAITGQTLAIGDEFCGRDSYLWAQKTLTLPAARQGFELCGLFDFGKTGGGHNSGFESLLYVNGQPYQGVDTNHMDVVLEGYAGQAVELTFLLWTGLEGGGPHVYHRHRIRQADIGYLHLETDRLYYLSKAIYKTLLLLDDTCADKYLLEAALTEAYKLVNWDEDKFYDTVGAALALLEQKLDAAGKDARVTVNVVGHTHIDVAWLWRLKHTREKAIRSFSTVLRLMEEFDEYIFLQSQPQLYRYIQQDAPELYARIKDAVKGGRWEADGGMWVEADCNISSGEALVRQFTHGIRFMKEEFEVDCKHLWLPDVFGYSWALPQILKQCNIKTFMTIKISWSQFNSMPHDLFHWRGIDGSEVLTYFVSTPEIDGHPMKDWVSTYNGMLSPRSVLGSWAKFKDKNISNETLISYGYGDGGGGVNRNMLKMRRAMDRLPGLPNVKSSRAGDFFERLHQSVENTESYVHTWDGELYLEYHRGTYTSQAHNKKMNRRLEFAAARGEWLASLAWLAGAEYPEAGLHKAWESVLLHQFHDIIPGSSIREVYEDSDIAYAETEKELAALEREAVSAITAPEENSFALWHGGSFPYKGLAWLPAQGEGRFTGADGAPLPAQKAEGGYWVQVDLPPLGLGGVRFAPGKAAPAQPVFSYDAETRIADSPHYTVRWNEAGQITSLWDKDNAREALPAGAVANALEVYEDKPLAFDNWDIDIFYLQKACQYFAPKGEPQVLENGALRLCLRFEYAYNRSTLTQDVVLYAHSRRIDFVTEADWHECDRLLKAAFPVDVRATKATYDIQFGHVERPTHFNTSWDYARFEVVGHKWADLSDAGYGVSLLNDCKYGYSAHDNILSLTLLKSGKYPDTEADMGRHSFTYALLPHAGGFIAGDTIPESHMLNQPVRTLAGVACPPAEPLFRIDAPGVAVDAVKKAYDEDCLVLRVHECFGAKTPLKITSPRGIRRWACCNLLEETTGEAQETADITGTLAPFELKTYKVWLA